MTIKEYLCSEINRMDEVMKDIKEVVDIDDFSCLKDILEKDMIEFESVDQLIKYMSAFKIGLDLKNGRIKPEEVKTKLHNFIKKMVELTNSNSGSNPYEMISQGTSVNKIAKVNSKRNINTFVDNVSELDYQCNVTEVDNDFTLYTSLECEYVLTKGFTDSAARLLDIMLLKLTKMNFKSDTVNLTLAEYMDLRGLKDRQKAKKQLSEDFSVIRHTSFTSNEIVKVEGKRKKELTKFSFINLVYAGSITNTGYVTFSMSPRFINMLKNYYNVMPYPKSLLKISSKNNPYGYMLGRKILEHKHMNYHKKNADIISVFSLITAMNSIGLPTKDMIDLKGTRQIKRDIIKPFFRDMDSLKEILEWELYKDNERFPKEDINNYDDFVECNVHITWKNYPVRVLKAKRR